MAHVDGYYQTLYRINKEVNAMRGRTILGMTKALNHLHHETETVRPMVPRRTNFLAQSWYIFPLKTGVNPVVQAGYTAQYAAPVHDMSDRLADISWTRAGSGAKWLYIHFERNRREMQLIIAQNVRIKR